MKKNPYAIASLTMGILSFIQLFGIEKAIVAGIFGIMALAQIKKDTLENKNLPLLKYNRMFAVIGIVLAALYLLAVGFIFYFKTNEIVDVIRRFK